MTRGTPMREAMRPNPRLSSSASARETRVLERASNLFSLASEERLGRSPYHPGSPRAEGESVGKRRYHGGSRMSVRRAETRRCFSMGWRSGRLLRTLYRFRRPMRTRWT